MGWLSYKQEVGQVADFRPFPSRILFPWPTCRLGQTDIALVTQLLESTVQLESLNGRLQTLQQLRSFLCELTLTATPA